jgi:hypothetical protein
MNEKNEGTISLSCLEDCDCDSIVLDAKHLITKYHEFLMVDVMSSKRFSIPEIHSKKRILGSGEMRHHSIFASSASMIGSFFSVSSIVF